MRLIHSCVGEAGAGSDVAACRARLVFGDIQNCMDHGEQVGTWPPLKQTIQMNRSSQ